MIAVKTFKMLLLISTLLFSVFLSNVQAVWVDSAKYDCGHILPPGYIDVVESKSITIQAADSIDGAWERSKIALLPASQHMWLYVYALLDKKIKLKQVNCSQKSEVCDVVIKSDPASSDSKVIKHIKIDDKHRCSTYTVKRQGSSNNAGKHLMKMKKINDKEVEVTFVTFGCTDPNDLDSCMQNNVITRAYFKCLVISKNLEACADYARDHATFPAVELTSKCSVVPKKDHAITVTEKINNVDMVTAWKRLKNISDPTSSWYNIPIVLKSLMTGPMVIHDIGGKQRYEFTINNPLDLEFGHARFSTSSFKNENNNYCHSFLISDRILSKKLNAQYKLAIELHDKNGQIYMQYILYDCLSSRAEYRSDLCTLKMYNYMKILTSFLKCMMENWSESCFSGA